LPTSGTKESLKKRLELGIGDQRRKDKSAKKETEISVPPEFYNRERQTLLDLGMTNEVKIAEEVTRRYSVVESTRKPEPTLFSFPQPLPDETRKQTNLEFVAMSDKGEFQYKMIMPGEEEEEEKKKDTPKGTPKGTSKGTPLSQLREDMRMLESSSSESKKRDRDVVVKSEKSESKKVKKEKQEPAADEKAIVIDDGPDDGGQNEEVDPMKWPSEITVERLMKKASKESMLPLLRMFVSPVPDGLSMQQIAEALGEQLHYETDDEEEDDDE